ncbi:LysR family transcriptional regulator [Piscinibacter terrae]|uniref:LysR family transcriptional regulator n=1 Tax=Piscinibacter terrae TaxID=2496871 RepID=A0A3N7HRR5_9BURK|nr:LysR family transcriptional regulator [Albitalea terrae]RQP24433.1 LysR family transcriptional regulator [Albitalea terrae]
MSDIDWDDLRVALAVAEAGSLAGAARALNVNHTTALRRLDALEARLNTRLFDRQRGGYVPTEAGELLAEEARAIAPRVDDLQRRLQGRDLRLTGTVRLTTAFVLMAHLLPEPLAAFARAHPGIEVEVAESSVLLDLSRRQADVAIRISQQVPQHWVGRTLGMVEYRVYARRGAPALPQRETPLPELLAREPWISFEREMFSNRFGRWMQEHIPPGQVRLRVDMFNSLSAMLLTGLGVGVLPDFVAAREPDLVAVSGPIADLATPLWILTHPDLRRTARIQAFMRLVGDSLAQLLAKAT